MTHPHLLTGLAGLQQLGATTALEDDPSDRSTPHRKRSKHKQHERRMEEPAAKKAESMACTQRTCRCQYKTFTSSPSTAPASRFCPDSSPDSFRHNLYVASESASARRPALDNTDFMFLICCSVGNHAASWLWSGSVGRGGAETATATHPTHTQHTRASTRLKYTTRDGEKHGTKHSGCVEAFPCLIWQRWKDWISVSVCRGWECWRTSKTESMRATPG